MATGSRLAGVAEWPITPEMSGNPGPSSHAQAKGTTSSGRRRRGVNRPDDAPARPAQECGLGATARKTRPLVATGNPCASRMIPLESPVPEIGTPGSESGGRKRTHGCRPAARRESAGSATDPLPATRLPSTLPTGSGPVRPLNPGLSPQLSTPAGRAGFVPENRPHSTCGGRPPPPVGPGRRPLRRGGDRRVGSTFSRAEACAGTARSCPAPPVSVDAGRRARPTRPVMRGCVGRRDSAGASSCRRGGRRGPPRVRPRRRRTGHRRVSAMAVARATIRIGAGRGRARVAAHWRAPLP